MDVQMSVTRTSAPAPANASAVARPTPRDAPVTWTTRRAGAASLNPVTARDANRPCVAEQRRPFPRPGTAPAGSLCAVVDLAHTRTGSGPPLVLVHGAAADADSFRLLAPLLAREF